MEKSKSMFWKNGIKVSNFHLAHINSKYGFKERLNYDKNKKITTELWCDKTKIKDQWI